MNATTQSEMHDLALSTAPEPSPELGLRGLDHAEMIYVGGGYCAADY